jgi:hypothetical protein
MRDPGEAAIVSALRRAGAFVWHLSAEGIPDLLVGHRKRWLLLEVKAAPGPRGGASEHGQKLSAAQERFFQDAELGELPAYVVRTPEEALTAIGIELVNQDKVTGG